MRELRIIDILVINIKSQLYLIRQVNESTVGGGAGGGEQLH